MEYKKKEKEVRIKYVDTKEQSKSKRTKGRFFDAEPPRIKIPFLNKLIGKSVIEERQFTPVQFSIILELICKCKNKEKGDVKYYLTKIENTENYLN